MVTGWFILLQGVLDGAINPGLQAVIEHIRKGTLDFVLLKPADAQFLVSTVALRAVAGVEPRGLGPGLRRAPSHARARALAAGAC